MDRWESLLEELHAEFLLREEELKLLHDIDLHLLESERPLSTTFELIVQRTRKLLKCDHTNILLKRGRFFEPAYSTTKSEIGQRIEISASLTGSCFTSGVSLIVPDVTEPPYSDIYVPIDGYTGEPMRSLLCTPIKVHDTTVGVLNSECTRVGAFKPEHETVQNAVSAQVAIALQRAQLFDRNALFSEVDQLIFSGGDSSEVIPAALAKVIDALQELEHIQLSVAQILFQRGKVLEIVYSTNPSDAGLVVELDKSISGRAVRERRTVIIGDVSTEPEYRSLPGPSTQSEIAVPILLSGDGGVIGVLNVESEEHDAFQGFNQIILESFAEKVRMLLAFAKLRSDVTATMEIRNASDLLVAVGDQASNMIHRINNTVGAMRMRIIELQDMQDSGELEANDFLAETLRSLRGLADRTLQMPDEVTLLLGQQGSTVKVNEAVREALGKFRIPGNVIVRLDLDPESPSLSLYCFDIVVQNLIQNALDAMPDGGSLSLSTSTVAPTDLPTGYVLLTVRDTGHGIPEDILPRIFDLNFSTKRDKGEGLGLGLWWIRNFVRRAEGDITVRSSAGSGTEFTVKIPFDTLSTSIDSSGTNPAKEVR